MFSRRLYEERLHRKGLRTLRGTFWNEVNRSKIDKHFVRSYWSAYQQKKSIKILSSPIGKLCNLSLQRKTNPAGFLHVKRKVFKFIFLFLSYFFVKKNTSQSARRVCYGRVDQRCMYVTPIRLDVLLNTNQISCCKCKWYVRRFDPDIVENGRIYSSVKEEEVSVYCVYLEIFCGLG